MFVTLYSLLKHLLPSFILNRSLPAFIFNDVVCNGFSVRYNIGSVFYRHYFLRKTCEDIDMMSNVGHFALLWASPAFQSQVPT